MSKTGALESNFIKNVCQQKLREHFFILILVCLFQDLDDLRISYLIRTVILYLIVSHIQVRCDFDEVRYV